MKKGILLLFLVSIIGCKKVEVLPQDNAINLGVEATATKITKVYPFLSNGSSVNFDLETTIGSKYTLQITDIMGNEIKSFGFTASEIFMTKTVNVSDLGNGDYGVVLTDIKGNQSKTSIIIKK